eukprot:m.29764 g.29764  ORF g.29764 m.29764 type:complete len:252 (+) comp12101_c0_seq1:77-832(+)
MADAKARAASTSAMYGTQFSSPLGELTAAVTQAGALAFLKFGAVRPQACGTHPVVWCDQAASAAPAAPVAAALAEVQRQVLEYCAGKRRAFDLPVDVDHVGTDFQRKVWAGLQRLKFGETVSYKELAARIGQPGASRAVGNANGKNQVVIVIPCHRVVGSGRQLGGFSCGLDKKKQLLAIEQVRDIRGVPLASTPTAKRKTSASEHATKARAEREAEEEAEELEEAVDDLEQVQATAAARKQRGKKKKTAA